MTPYQFLARLAALIPHPREHGLTYQGILAPAGPLRDQVVPRPVVRKEVKNDTENADAEGARTSSGVPAEGQSDIRWAGWLCRFFGVDVLRCPRCKGRRHMISVITDPETARKALEGVRSESRTSFEGVKRRHAQGFERLGGRASDPVRLVGRAVGQNQSSRDRGGRSATPLGTPLRLSLNPSNPGAGQNYGATLDVSCLPTGSSVELSVVGTDGYTHTHTFDVSAGQLEGLFNLDVPGAKSGVMDTVTGRVSVNGVETAMRVTSLVLGG